MAALVLAHAIARPVSTLPAASFVVAVSCVAAPTSTVASAGLTVTDATGAIETVIEAVPLRPSLVAVMAAEPAATPVTRPLGLTVATAAALLVHVIVRPVSGLPAESSGLAVSCLVPPTKRLAGLGLTDSDAITSASLAEVSAVYTPLGVIVPPDVLNRTVAGTLSPVAVRPKARKGWVCWGSRATLSGRTTICTTAPDVGPVVCGANSHAARSVSPVAAAQGHLVRKYITPPDEREVRQLDWHGTRWRAVAPGLCVACL